MSEMPSHPASGGSYVVENGVRRQVEAPTREHPGGNGPRPAPRTGQAPPAAEAAVAAAIDAAAEADEAAAPLKPSRKGVSK